MADGGISVDAPTAAIAGSIGTAILAWLGNRLVGKAAIQTAVAVTYEKQTATFKELLDQLRQELRDATRERDEERAKVMRLEAEIRQKDAIIAGFERTTVMPHGKGGGQ